MCVCVLILIQGHFLHCFLESEKGRKENIDGREKHWLVASGLHPDRGSRLGIVGVGTTRGWHAPRLGMNRSLGLCFWLEIASKGWCSNQTEPHWPGPLFFIGEMSSYQTCRISCHFDFYFDHLCQMQVGEEYSDKITCTAMRCIEYMIRSH